MENFGNFERPFNESEKEIITKFLKYDKHVPLRIAEMVYSAEVESEYFGRAGTLLGGISAVAFFYFPIIRQQPGLRRLALCAIPGYGFWKWGQVIQDDLRWTKIYTAYQKFVQYHGQNPRLFV